MNQSKFLCFRLISLKINLADENYEMEWHISVDLLAHACVPNLDISPFLSSTSFSLISRDDSNFRAQLKISKELHAIFQVSINKRQKTGSPMELELNFSMKLFRLRCTAMCKYVCIYMYLYVCTLYLYALILYVHVLKFR